jgi:hypothetical protein
VPEATAPPPSAACDADAKNRRNRQNIVNACFVEAGTRAGQSPVDPVPHPKNADLPLLWTDILVRILIRLGQRTPILVDRHFRGAISRR